MQLSMFECEASTCASGEHAPMSPSLPMTVDAPTVLAPIHASTADSSRRAPVQRRAMKPQTTGKVTRARADSSHPTPTAAAEQRFNRAFIALEEATRIGSWASGAQLAEAWTRAYGTAVPREVVGRWSRALEVGIRDGRVVTRTEQRAVVYAPAARATELMPHGGSDLMRVETAVARAVTRHGGAIPVESIEEEIASDPKLRIATDATSLASRVIRLAEQRRIRRVRGTGRIGADRWYYTTNDGPTHVARDQERELDRRVRAIQALWRASGGRPFTTRAISEYGEARDGFSIADDTVYGWTNALQHLARTGYLVQVKHDSDAWHARWVIADAWTALSEHERAVRLTDALGRGIGPVAVDDITRDDKGNENVGAQHGRNNSPRDGGLTAPRDRYADPDAQEMSIGWRSATPTKSPQLHIDVGHASRAQDMRTLTQLAVHARLNGVEEPAERMVLSQRPLTLEELTHTRTSHRRLLPAKHQLMSALHEAMRVRPDMRRAALLHLGTVRNTTYFACDDSIAGRAFVDYKAAMADADLGWLERMASDLERERAVSATPVNPLPPAILLARAFALVTELAAVRRRLHEALKHAPLFTEEHVEAKKTHAALEELLTVAERSVAGLSGAVGNRDVQTAEAIMREARVAEFVGPPAWTLADIRMAEQQCQGLFAYEMNSPRAFWARFPNAVRVYRMNEYATTARLLPTKTEDATSAAKSDVRREPTTKTTSSENSTTEKPRAAVRTRGRQVRTALDRVGLGMWLGRRVGGETLCGIASQALYAVGELRDPTSLMHALKTTDVRASHTALCAALMFFDDTACRDALVGFLWRALEDDELSLRKRVDAPDEPGESANAQGALVHERQTSATAVATAAYGLARRPCAGLATDLRECEREVLTQIATTSSIPYARATATRVLKSWVERWDRDRLLYL